MTPSEKLIDFLMGWEGPPHYVPRQDPVNLDVWDIGYGCTCSPSHGPIDEDGAVGLLRARVHLAGDSLHPNVPLAQNQFDALVSFAYNLGIHALNTSTLWHKLNSNDYVGAADEFGKWNHAAGVEVAGLTKRRAAERAMFTAGDYSLRP